jgi:hypothetical protein
VAFAQEPKLAAEGRGLLPRPPAATPEGPRAAHPFYVDPSGALSRTIFETDEDPNFRLIIRDFIFLPNKHPDTVTLPSGAFLHILSGKGEVSIGKKPMALTLPARTPVSPGAPIEVGNSDEYPVEVQALIVEAK